MAERAAHSPGSRTGRGHALRSFLEGFRRPAAVPTSTGRDLSAELAPLFAELDRIETEAGLARAAAALRRQADDGEAAEEAELILSFAQGQADGERDEVIKAARRAADAEVHRILAEGAATAGRIREQGRARCDPLVDEIVRQVLSAGQGAGT